MNPNKGDRTCMYKYYYIIIVLPTSSTAWIKCDIFLPATVESS